MRTVQNLKTDLNKILTGYGFYLAIFFTALLCFSASVYMDEVKNESYSVFDVLHRFDRSSMTGHEEFFAITVAMKGTEGWLSLFIPIIAGFVFVPLFCEEIISGTIRFTMFRSSYFRYYTSKYLSACFSAGLAVMIGYGIYMGIVFFCFPRSADFSKEMYQIISSEITKSYPVIDSLGDYGLVLLKLAEVFFYGTVMSVPALFLLTISQNKYLVLCIPFFLTYGMMQFCTKLEVEALSDPVRPNMLLWRIGNILKPDTVANLENYGADKRYVLLYQAVVCVFLYIGYLLILRRRRRYGE